MKELYKNGLKFECSIPEENTEPDILLSDVERAIQKLKRQKSPGEDGVTAELLQQLEETGINLIHIICSKVWRNGFWPKD